MQIDRYNFATHFDSICDKINRASFVSFDCEFTGLVTNLEKIEGKFADHTEFYQRIKETALNFKILQFGLTAFVFNQKNRYYQPFSYNFYTLPYVNVPGYNNIMISEVDSLAFLSSHGIDWNRIFKNGIIPQRLLQPFQYKNHNYDSYDQSEQQYFYGPQDKKLIEEIHSLLVRISEKKIEEVIDFRKNSIYKYFLSRYLDKLILRKGKKTYKKFEFVVGFMGKINDDKSDDIVFEKDEKAVKYVEKKMKEEKMENEYQNPSIEALLKIVSNRQLPIIGHFPNLDLGLVYHTYFQALPQTYEQFTEKLNKLFPFVFDTKILSRRVAGNFKGMKVSLGNLYGACQEPRYLKNYCNVIQSKEAKENNNRHEAGYDSYLTGYVFVGMANWILNNDKGNPVNFNQLHDLNGLIYSRQTGQISLHQPYCPFTYEYNRKILILNQPMTSKVWKEIAQKLSVYGTLSVTEDHGQTYFVFEEETDKMLDILNEFKQKYDLRHYSQRKILKGRDIYVRSQEQLQYN